MLNEEQGDLTTMHKVMLIDDDVPVLKYLQGLIPWEQMGLTICASTYSSVKALQLFHQHKPDIVITDIGIPQMDGFELVSMFRQERPDVKVIFLTCHEDFQYARRALQINADDYLIKDELTSEKLESAVVKSVEKLNTQSKYLDSASIRNTLNRNKLSLVQAFTEQLSGGTSYSELQGEARQLGYEWKHDSFMLSVTAIHYAAFTSHYRFKDVATLKYGLYNIAEELCSREKSFTPILDKDYNLIMIYNFFNRLDMNPHQSFRLFLQELNQKVKQFLNIDLIHYFSKHPVQAPSLGHMLITVKNQINNYYYRPYEMLHAVEIKSQVWNLADMILLRNYEEEWLKTFRQGNIAHVRSFIDTLRGLSERWQIHPDKFKSVMLRWLQSVLDSSPSFNKEFESCFMQTCHVSMTLSLMEYASTTALVDSLAAPKPELEEPNPKIHEIEQYIMSHLSENITSLTMANHLHLNPSYFSRYFKRLTGETFTDYVHSLKMRVAAKLLVETNHTVEFISYSLGYSDRTYFSKIFSKYVGLSPTEYKQVKG
jgi:two-component system, response regulator YesN